VVVLDGGLALRPGPRVGDAAESLAAILHPDPSSTGVHE
jgi:hypothetical protein